MLPLTLVLARVQFVNTSSLTRQIKLVKFDQLSWCSASQKVRAFTLT